MCSCVSTFLYRCENIWPPQNVLFYELSPVGIFCRYPSAQNVFLCYHIPVRMWEYIISSECTLLWTISSRYILLSNHLLRMYSCVTTFLYGWENILSPQNVFSDESSPLGTFCRSSNHTPAQMWECVLYNHFLRMYSVWPHFCTDVRTHDRMYSRMNHHFLRMYSLMNHYL